MNILSFLAKYLLLYYPRLHLRFQYSRIILKKLYYAIL